MYLQHIPGCSQCLEGKQLHEIWNEYYTAHVVDPQFTYGRVWGAGAGWCAGEEIEFLSSGNPLIVRPISKQGLTQRRHLVYFGVNTHTHRHTHTKSQMLLEIVKGTLQTVYRMRSSVILDMRTLRQIHVQTECNSNKNFKGFETLQYSIISFFDYKIVYEFLNHQPRWKYTINRDGKVERKRSSLNCICQRSPGLKVGIDPFSLCSIYARAGPPVTSGSCGRQTLLSLQPQAFNTQAVSRTLCDETGSEQGTHKPSRICVPPHTHGTVAAFWTLGVKQSIPIVGPGWALLFYQ